MITTSYGRFQTQTHIDPIHYQAAISGGDNLYSLMGRGVFRADLTEIEVGEVALQNGRENLPRLVASSMPTNRVGVVVWPASERLPVVRGVQIRPGELLCVGSGLQSYHRTFGPNEYTALTVDATAFADAVRDLAGYDLVLAAGKVLRPPQHVLARLLSVIRSAIRVIETTPQVLSSPQAAKALEQALLRTVIASLQHKDAGRDGIPSKLNAILAKRFEEAVEANLDRPLFSRELSSMVGVSERTLRRICQEQMGISPLRFLALRRLHLAHQALLRADRHSATVTEIAMEFGIWELGRFAVAYKSRFGESPSTTLHRRSGP